MSTTDYKPMGMVNERLKTSVLIVLSLWFALAFVGSISGVFDSYRRPPAALGMAAFLPVIVFLICYWRWIAFREFVLGLDVRFLTLAQTWRVGGIVFVILYYQD